MTTDCPYCGGEGAITCPRCDGSGQVEAQSLVNENAMSLKDCPNCNGAGMVKCPAGCDGQKQEQGNGW